MTELFQARGAPLRNARGSALRCPSCADQWYAGLAAAYEVMQVDAHVRAVIRNGGSVNQLKAAFRKQGGRFLQETALDVVKAGETDVKEVLRVLKGEAPPVTA